MALEVMYSARYDYYSMIVLKAWQLTQVSNETYFTSKFLLAKLMLRQHLKPKLVTGHGKKVQLEYSVHVYVFLGIYTL